MSTLVQYLHQIVISSVKPNLPETSIKPRLCLKTVFGGIPPDYGIICIVI